MAFEDNSKLLARLLSCILMIVLLACGIATLVTTKFFIGIYILAVSVLVFFVEFIFLFNCQCCYTGCNGCLGKFVVVASKIKYWQRGLLYICFSPVCFIYEKPAIGAGVALALAGLFYIFMWHKGHEPDVTIKYTEEQRNAVAKTAVEVAVSEHSAV